MRSTPTSLSLKIDHILVDQVALCKDLNLVCLRLRAGVAEQSGRPAGAAAMEEGERGRSWYLSKEEIERGSPSRRDGVGTAKEAQLRATYCSFIREVGLRLQL
jgi:hypothetical protein